MKRILAILLACAVPAMGQTICTVTGHLSRAISQSYTNMVLTFTPQSTPITEIPLLVSGAAVTTTSTAPLGFFTIDLEHGVYSVRIGSLPRDTFTITIPAATTETNHIQTYITSGATTNFVAGDTTGWTQTAADSRYAKITNGVLVLPILSNNTATVGWVWTATNAQGGAHWAVSSGGAGTPGGGESMMQVNESSAFAANSNMFYHGSSGETRFTNNIGPGHVRFSVPITMDGIQTNGSGLYYTFQAQAQSQAMLIQSDGLIVADPEIDVNEQLALNGITVNIQDELNDLIGATNGLNSNRVMTNHNTALGTNWISGVADVGAPDSADILPILDVSTATRKYVTASQLVAAGGAGTVTHTSGALTADLPLTGNGGDDIKTNTVAGFLTILSVPTHAQLVTASNALNTALVANDTTTSNGAVAFTMTASNNLATSFIANDTTTSNGLVTLLVSNDTITSNGAVAFTMTASNNLATSYIANDTTTSNGLVTLLVANDTTTSNGVVSFVMTTSNTLATAYMANDTTTSNGLIAILNTKVETNHNSALGTNFISGVADIGTPAAGDLVPILDVSTAQRKYAAFSTFAGAATAGGSDTQVQYNNGGSLDGTAGIIVSDTEQSLNINSNLTAYTVTATNGFTSLGVPGVSAGGIALYETNGVKAQWIVSAYTNHFNITNIWSPYTNAIAGHALVVSSIDAQGTEIIWTNAAVATTAQLNTASNALVTILVANDTTTSNGVVSFVMTTSNTLATAYIANDTTTSNGAVAFTMTASNNLATAYIANDTTTSNGLIAILNTKVETNFNSALGTNFISHVADVGTPNSADLIPILDVSTAERKYVTAGELIGAGANGPGMLDFNAGQFATNGVVSITNLAPVTNLVLWGSTTNRSGDLVTLGNLVAVGTLTADGATITETTAMTDATVANSLVVSGTTTTTQLKYPVWTNYVNTVSNFVFSFNTNRYELKNQTNVVFTNLVEEATATSTDMAVHIHNTTGVTMGLRWPSYGAQHGYFFHTNANNAILAATSLASGQHGVASFTAYGTNIFATFTTWP